MGGECPASKAVNNVLHCEECCRLTATLTNMAALLKLDLCKDCRDLFLSVYKLYFILLRGKPLSNQNLCSMSDLLALGRAGVLAYKESPVYCGTVCTQLSLQCC